MSYAESAEFDQEADQIGTTNHRKSPDRFSMHDLEFPLLSDGGAMMESERNLAEYLTRIGFTSEAGMSNEAKAKAMQKRRAENYHNVISFLENYRSLRRTYDLFKSEFAEEVISENHLESTIVRGKSSGLFDQLSKELELMSVAEERRFQSVFAPQISAGRKIEVAMNAMQFGLRLLRAEDAVCYDLINVAYIKGETKPTIREILTALGYTSNSSYYHKREVAWRKLTTAIFGYCSNKAELISILVYLRQQTDDDYFPDYD